MQFQSRIENYTQINNLRAAQLAATFHLLFHKNKLTGPYTHCSSTMSWSAVGQRISGMDFWKCNLTAMKNSNDFATDNSSDMEKGFRID